MYKPDLSQAFNTFIKTTDTELILESILIVLSGNDEARSDISAHSFSRAHEALDWVILAALDKTVPERAEE